MTALTQLDADTHARKLPADICEPAPGIANVRRSAQAVYAIGRIVGNSIRNRDDGIEPLRLQPHIEAGLMDALELIALYVMSEADSLEWDTNPQIGSGKQPPGGA